MPATPVDDLRRFGDPEHARPGIVDLDAIRATIASGQGPAFWQSLEAVASTSAFKRFLEREYPAAAHLARGPDRRGFFKIMAASFAMTGLAACGSTEDGRTKEVAYVRQPEGLEAGVALSYASNTLIDGFANGVLVTTVNGRPIKIEGNPEHPWSLGGTDVFGQASVLGLYDPMRSQTVRQLDRIANWDAFRSAQLGPFRALKAAAGTGLRLLTGPVTSPSLLDQISAILKALPQAKWHVAAAPSSHAAASLSVFGHRVDTRWHFDRARVVVAIDGDFLDAGASQVGLARRWAQARHALATKGSLLELHAMASTPNLTSAKADYHLAAEPNDILALIGKLKTAIESSDASGGAAKDAETRWVARAANALRAAKGETIVLAGTTQSAAVHAAVHRLNIALGNIGKTITFAEPALPEAGTLADLVADMLGGDVSTLLMLEVNPVYTAPGDLDFKAALAKVGQRIHAGLYVDETALRCDWHLPLSHPLESWGDARSVDGTAGLIQPTIRPFYDSKTMHEILSLLFEDAPREAQAIVRAFWQGAAQTQTYDPVWRKALLAGFFENTASAERFVTASAETPVSEVGPPLDLRSDTVTLLFRTDPTIGDGAHAGNGWLQELPKPLTKIVWDNVAAISPALAGKYQLANGDVIALSLGDKHIEAPVWIVPGQAKRSVTLTLGYGRAVQDMIFDGLGYDAGPLRLDASPWMAEGATLVKTGRTVVIATTQDHNAMEGHDFIRLAREGDAPQRAAEGSPVSLYGASETKTGARAWGMVIDTDGCIGCNACVVACQAENNIAIVGKEQIAEGRGMHWLRVDRYYSCAKTDGRGLDQGLGLDDPDTHFQPVPCMHCELAPCEVGCPVEATLHDHEGLNLMVYNRCVGTRACSGYCPYKVRHFNYLDYSGGVAPSIQAGRNPDVSVRSRGVMEKCTYCVQRIASARIASDMSGEPIKDGAVQTACQTACPTQAITFGDLADAGSAVAAKRKDARNYDLLGELNVRPRTTYLAERAPRRPAREG